MTKIIFRFVLLILVILPHVSFGNNDTFNGPSGYFGYVKINDLDLALQATAQAVSGQRVLSEQEKKNISKVVASSVWNRVLSNDDDYSRIDHLISVLFKNSKNLENDIKLFKEIGLTDVPDRYYEKLIDKKINGGAGGSTIHSNFFLLARKPLQSFEVGLGDGKTAEELNIKYILHRVKGNLEVLKSIENSETNHPNALISSAGSMASRLGQSTMFGEGFYTSVLESDLTYEQPGIILVINKNARNGHDFNLITPNQYTSPYVIVLNKRAVSFAHTRQKWCMDIFTNSLK